MADSKLTALTGLAAASGDDLLYVVDDPGGTPASKKITVTALFTSPRVTTAITDANGNEIIKTPATGSAVNEITVTNAASGNAVSIAATGGDDNIALTVAGKGTGAVQLGQATSTDVRLVADQPIADSAGNELIKFVKTTTAVNEVTITNAATNTNPKLSATGGDTNIGINLTPKGTGVPYSTVISGIGLPTLLTVTTDATAGALTYTAAMFKGGLILRDPAGAGRSDVTPTAANLVAAFPGCPVGTSFEFIIKNTADADETITVTGGDGATLVGTMTIGQNNSKRFLVRLDNVTGSSEAYTVYSLGTSVH